MPSPSTREALHKAVALGDPKERSNAVSSLMEKDPSAAELVAREVDLLEVGLGTIRHAWNLMEKQRINDLEPFAERIWQAGYQVMDVISAGTIADPGQCNLVARAMARDWGDNVEIEARRRLITGLEGFYDDPDDEPQPPPWKISF